MAVTQYEIGASWTAISTAGQSGAAWLDEGAEENSKADDVRIVHATSMPPATDFEKGKRVSIPKGNSDTLSLLADSAADIFYARARSGTAILNADMG